MRTWAQVAVLSVASLIFGFVCVPAATAATAATNSLSVLNALVTEGDANRTVSVTVQLSRTPTQRTTVNLTTVNGIARAPADYVAKSTLVVFPAGVRAKKVPLTIMGDLLDEANETLAVKLSRPTGARIADGAGVVKIVDNDPLPSVSVDNLDVLEGDTGSQIVGFPVRLSAPSGRTVSVPFAISSGTATPGGDYTAVPATGTLVFTAGEQLEHVYISVIGDTTDETTETVNLSLLVPVNAAIADSTGLLSIDDNDGPSITINNITANEGWTANKPYTFTVSLSAISPQEVRVNYASANNTAVAPSDYTALTPGTLIFTPGQVSKTISVMGQGDLNVETTESFLVNLGSPVNAVIGDSQGVGTITNDDFASYDEGWPSAYNLGAVAGDEASASRIAFGDILLGDADWYKVYLAEAVIDYWTEEELWARIQLAVADGPAQTSGDIDMRIYRADGTGPVAGWSTLGTTDEQAFVRVEEAVGFLHDDDNGKYFLIKVFGVGSVINNYTLTVTGDISGNPYGAL